MNRTNRDPNAIPTIDNARRQPFFFSDAGSAGLLTRPPSPLADEADEGVPNTVEAMSGRGADPRTRHATGGGHVAPPVARPAKVPGWFARGTTIAQLL